MRIKGRLEKWNDERGFGFIKPLQDEPAVFAHISAFQVRNPRPHVGQLLVFEIGTTADGKKRAVNVQAAGVRAASNVPQRPPWGAATFLAVPAFIALYLAIAMLWSVPIWVGVLYLALSGVSFIYYAKDKSAAASGSWRISEAWLLTLGLAGGWPGAIFAQQILRHKSSKGEFRAVFWASVIANATAFILCFSPAIALLRR